MIESSSDTRHWHVTLTLAGAAVEPLLVRAALQRLVQERPFLNSLTFSSTTAELQFWDEGESMMDVASMALRVWNEHRSSTGLPRWEVVGMEIVERALRDQRSSGPDPRGGSISGQVLAPITL